MIKLTPNFTVKKYIPPVIIQFFKIYCVAITFFTLFRVLLFITELERINNKVSYIDIFQSFIIGLRFDIVISSYILILPFVLASISYLLYPKSTKINKLNGYYMFIMFSIAFLICSVDIPYFNQFFSRFTISAFEWFDSPIFILKMIFQEPRYWLFILPYIIIVYLFYLFLKINKHVELNNFKLKLFNSTVAFLICLILILIGIRGRIEEKSPIRVGTAYFSNNAFLNQLGLNPNFTLIKSYLDSRKEENKTFNLIDDSVAISNVQKYLNIKNPNKKSPVTRKIVPTITNPTKNNIVLIMMESMSAAKMKRHGNKNNLTPFLDSLSNKGYYFNNTYTAGIHTFNGIFSTLFSYPALFRQHPMRESSILKYHGIFSTLKQNNYSTIYFTTHDGQFDNVEGFLKANDCETVISKDNYPSDKIKTTLGVPDDYMFEFSIPILNKLNKKNKPFIAAFMTASDHGPYYLPEYFKPKNLEIKKQIVEYADYSIEKFINLSKKQKWFKNTIFIFVADHGAPIDGTYNMSIDYNHTPLLFFAPNIFKKNKTINNMAGQIDIFPTIMGLLQLPYTNNTLGIDLFKDKRPYIFFGADDKYGVIDDNWFLIVENENSKKLYKYKKQDLHNYSNEKPDVVKKMNIYAQSHLQTHQYIINNKCM